MALLNGLKHEYQPGTLDVVLQLQAVYVAVGVLFNVASILGKFTPRSVLTGIFGMAVHGLIVAIGFEADKKLYYGAVMGLFIPNIAYYGISYHFNNRAKNDLAGYAGSWSWSLAIIINVVGVCLAIGGVWISFGLRPSFLFVIYPMLLIKFYVMSATATSAGQVSDCCWNVYEVPTSQRWRFKAQYIKMPDGKELACDMYLPTKPGKYPTMLHFTRYNRNFGLNTSLMNPVKSMSADGISFNMRSVKYAERFVPSGYAWVTVDVRGTGASGGSRPVDFSPQEVKDYQTVLQWVLEQDFCNGKIGSCGISYDGMAGIYLAASKHPAVKAIAPVCFPYDIYEDMCAPGGLACGGAIEDYAAFVKALESGDMTKVKGMVPDNMYNLMAHNLTGVMPIKGEEGKIDEVLKDHASNWDMTSLYEKCSGKDTVIATVGGKGMTGADFGPSAVMADLKANKQLAVYTIGAWYDAGAVGGAFKFHQELKEAGLKSKLTVGPWSHGCRKNCSPFAFDENPKFDLYAELVRFFDFHLKGATDTLIEEEPDMHFWTIGAEHWRSGYNWPLRDVSTERMFFGNKGKLVNFQAGSSKLPLPPGVTADEWLPDYEAGTGRVSRWNYVQHIAMQVVSYSDRASRGPQCLVYASLPLEKDLVISGSPVVDLRMEMDATDAGIFVYLEEEVSDEVVRYVTEGQLRASHRKRPSTYLTSDVKPMPVVKDGPSKDKVEHLTVKMQPVSYYFRAGSRIRVSLAAADVDNFLWHDADQCLTHFGLFPDQNLPKRATKWWVHRGQTAPSVLELPVEGDAPTFVGDVTVAGPERPVSLDKKPALPKGMSWRSQKIKGRRWSSSAPMAAVEEYKGSEEYKTLLAKQDAAE
mmetsp:Transcript_37315/g.88168  ORF Transcript_37315/g.88168 Transcript_37315/m.88168 type:complete len:866 (-) Transcript_37315:56-2653(-)